MEKCAICNGPVGADALVEKAGLLACARCRGGDPHPGLRAHGFEHSVSEHHFGGSSGMASSENMLNVMVRRPSELEAVAVLRPEVSFRMPRLPLWRRLLWKPDPDDPNQERKLDVELEVDTFCADAVQQLILDPGVREVLQMLAPLDSGIQLGFTEDAVQVRRLASEPLPDGDEVLYAMFLMSLHRVRMGC